MRTIMQGKIQFLLLVVSVALVNTIVFSAVPGCGTFRAVPLAIGWHLVDSVRGGLFADRHTHLVAAVSALLSACFLAVLMSILGLIARKMGWLASPQGLSKLLAGAAFIYVILGLLPIPVGPCF